MTTRRRPSLTMKNVFYHPVILWSRGKMPFQVMMKKMLFRMGLVLALLILLALWVAFDQGLL